MSHTTRSIERAFLALAPILLLATADVPVAQANLRSWWKGDGDATDAGPAANHGTLVGGATFAPGQLGQAFSFGGAGDYVDLGDHSAFRQGDAITYAFWARMPSGGGGWAMGAGAYGGHGYGGVYLDLNTLAFAWTPTSPPSDRWIVATGLGIAPGAWVHVALVVDFSNQGRALYINGAPVPTDLADAPTDWHPIGSYSSGQPDSIGRRWINTFYFFNGLIDDVQIYNHALAAAEIGQVMLGTPAPPAFSGSFQALGVVTGAGSCDPAIEGISGDGSTIIGHCGGPSPAFRWTDATGIVPVDDSLPLLNSANGVSFDGSVIVGSGQAAYRWLLGSGTSFIFSPIIRPDGSSSSSGYGVSNDGQIVVGSRQTLNSEEAFRWTPATGMVGLGLFCDRRTYAVSTSSDGSVIAGGGSCYGSSFPDVGIAWRWTPATGIVSLGVLPGHGRSTAYAVSADGSAIVGSSGPESGFSSGRPFLWKEATGMVDLGRPAGAPFEDQYAAFDVANEGCTVVGGAGTGAIIWDPVNGMRYLADVLVNQFGLNLTGYQLLNASGISDDGTVITGSAQNVALGRVEPYRVTMIPNPACNTAPFGDAGPDQTVNEGALVTLDGSGSSDPEGSALGYQWTQTDGPPVALDLTDPVHPTFTAPPVPPSGGLVGFELVVTDDLGNTGSDAVEIGITNVNAPPVANAGPDQTVAEGAAVALDGTGSLDQDGDALYYAWVQTAGPHVALTGAGTAQPSFTSPPLVVAAGETLTFELTVGDGYNAYATDSVNVFVSHVNLAPSADAGPDQAVDEGASVALDGTGSRDPDGDALSYHWIKVAGPAVTLNLANPARPTFTAPVVPRGGTTLSFELSVSDGALASGTDLVDVTVRNLNHVPVADAGDDQALAEGSPVSLDASQSYDVDGESLSYSWLQIVGPGVALAGAATATPSFTAPLVGAAGATLSFEVTVSDGEASAADSVDVVVENVNHPPTANAGLDQTRNEGSLVTLDGSGSSDPDSDLLAYQWTQASGPTVVLANATSPSPSFTAPQVGPGGAVLEFDLVVNDGLAPSGADRVAVAVQDVNAPPLCGGAAPSVAVLWPPNHKFVAISIGGVSDPNGGPVTIAVTGVTQDEALNGLGDGDASPDAIINGAGVQLRAERSGLGDGRVYRVNFTARNATSASCQGSVGVCVPHDKKDSCTDSGQSFDSTRR